MDPFKEQLDLYIKAGMPKKVILEKIGQEFGPLSKAKAEEILIANTKAEKAQNKLFAFLIMGVIAFFIIIIIYFLLPSIFVSQNFNSSKCPSIPKISIEGSPEFKQKIFDALLLIENKDCNYLRFVAQNSPNIYSESVIIPASNFYSSIKHTMEQDYSTSNYFIANAIIHEACHGFQHNIGVLMNEHDCALTQYNFLASIGAPSEDLQLVLALKSSPDYYFDENNTDVFAKWQKQNK